MKKSMPRRIAAGALFTAAVGFSVGAIAAPAQADAFSPHQAYRTAAYVPDHVTGNDIWRFSTARPALNEEFAGRPARSDEFVTRPAVDEVFATRPANDDPCGCSPDRVRGQGDEDYGMWPLVGAGRDVRVDDERSHPVRILESDRRDCPPDRNHEGAYSTIAYTVHPVVASDRRDCPPDRTRIRGLETSAYTRGHDVRVGDTYACGDHHKQGRGDYQHDRRHGHGGHGPRGR